MNDPIAILAEHAAETLPDSISKRKLVLTAILKVIKPQHRAFKNLNAQLATLEAAEALQRDLPLMFHSQTRNGE